MSVGCNEILFGGSGEISKWVANEDNWDYTVACRGYKFTCQISLTLQVSLDCGEPSGREYAT